MAVVAPANLRPTTPTLLVSFVVTFLFPITNSISEAEPLLALKTSFSNAQSLHTWDPSPDSSPSPCTWEGIICYNGLVTGLRLQGMALSGTIDVDALLQLKALRAISIINNSFSGSIPQLNRIGFLRAMYLSGNNFSGEIPPDYFLGMRSLRKLWLSENQFTGPIPSSLAEIPPLVELHLENNQFSGSIPNLGKSSLVEFNVSNNKLEGPIPTSLWNFSENSFAGNAGLCGDKFGIKCENATEQTDLVNALNNGTESNSNRSKVSSSVKIAAIVASSVVLISLVVFFLLRSRRRKEEEEEEEHDLDIHGKINNQEAQSEADAEAVEVQVSAPVKRDVEPMPIGKASSGKKGSSHGKRGIEELVMLNDDKGVFGLSDLMKGSAEVLGNGAFGSSYKVVMASGVAAVVKRMREMNALGKDGFDIEMKKLGRLRHHNILTPLAYHYRKEEKLVVFDYIPKGSLLYLLHGDRGALHAELDGPTRLNIVRGIAEGMRFLHSKFVSCDLPHGNLKSSNVLLGPDNEPLLVDYGFSPLVNPANSPQAQALFAYKAPEAAQGQVSHKCDVYCLGVIILEILTGKFPSQYLSNGNGGTDVVQWVASAISDGRESELLDPEIASSENSLGEMERLLHVGAACTESNPNQRLDMAEAIRRIEEIK